MKHPFKTEFQKYIAWFGALFAIAAIVFIIVVQYFDIAGDVTACFYCYADAMMDGIVPYTDQVQVGYNSEMKDWEYPPFAYVLLFIPRIFATTADGYQTMYIIEVFIFFLVGLWLTGKIAKRLSQNPFSYMLIYTVMMLLALEFVVDRFDVFPVIMTLAAIYCFIEKRYNWMFFILALATMTKLYPGLFFPLFIILLLMDRNWKVSISGILIFVGTILVILVAFLAMGSDVMMFVTYHSGRPLEVESTAASFIMVLSMLGLTTTWVDFSYGSDNLMGSLPDAISPALLPLTAVLVLVLYIFFAYAISKMDRNGKDTEINRLKLISCTMLLTVAVFIAAGKVFSGQYIIWVIPLVLFFLLGMSDYIGRRKLLFVYIGSIVLTQLNFAVNYGMRSEGEDFSDIGILIVLARNVFFIVMMIVAAYCAKEEWDKKIPKSDNVVTGLQ